MNGELPPALRPWEAQLAHVAPGAAGALTTLIARLALGIGPMRDRQERRGGEPNGYASVSRRGPYERLLATEWLLQRELPDEFLRRATQGEHLFLELEHKRPAAPKRCVVRFETGPMQIGRPRLVHVAALIVLARRAAEGGAAFAWGTLQEDALREEVDGHALMRMLEVRTVHAPDDAVLARHAADETAGERWVVASDGVCARAAGLGVRTLAVIDPLDPEARVLEVRLDRKRTLSLPLPGETESARVLRDPRALSRPKGPKSASKGIAPGSSIVLAEQGRKLLLRADDGGLLAMPIPGSPREPVGRMRAYPPAAGEAVLAAGTLHRKLAVLTHTAGGFALYGLGGPQGPSGLSRRELPWPEHGSSVLALAEPHFLGALVFGQVAGGGAVADLVAGLPGERRLMVIEHSLTQKAELAEGVLAWTLAKEGLLEAYADRHRGAAHAFPVRIVKRGDKTLDAHLGGPGARALAARGRLYFTLDGKTWWVHHGVWEGKPRKLLDVAAGQRVVGAWDQALVVHEPGARVLLALEQGRTRPIAAASGAITDVVQSADGQYLAWWTSDGVLEVHARAWDAIVLRIEAGK